MARDDWEYIQTPKAMFDEIKEIIKDDEFAKAGYSKPKDVALVIFREWMKNPKSILELTKVSEQGVISLIDTYDKKIILNDSEKGTILVQIDENLKLQCFDCKDDPHDNKYVRYVLKNKDLWTFLKKNKVKLVKPRPNDKDIAS